MRISILRTLFLLSACTSSQNAKVAAPEQTRNRGRQELVARFGDATQLVKELGGRVPPTLARRAECAVILPTAIRGGVLIGARHGRGFAVCRADGGLSAPAPVTMSGGSAGLQIGIESVDWLLLVVKDEGREALTNDKLSLGVGVSATAGPVGVGEEAATDAPLRAEVLTYSHSRGLFAGAELNGAVIEQDVDATELLYGSRPNLRKILKGELPVPPMASGFIGTLAVALATATAIANDTPSRNQ
jgi:lipid-binding SYLF domain-containing protein